MCGLSVLPCGQTTPVPFAIAIPTTEMIHPTLGQRVLIALPVGLEIGVISVWAVALLVLVSRYAALDTRNLWAANDGVRGVLATITYVALLVRASILTAYTRPPRPVRAGGTQRIDVWDSEMVLPRMANATLVLAGVMVIAADIQHDMSLALPYAGLGAVVLCLKKLTPDSLTEAAQRWLVVGLLLVAAPLLSWAVWAPMSHWSADAASLALPHRETVLGVAASGLVTILGGLVVTLVVASQEIKSWIAGLAIAPWITFAVSACLLDVIPTRDHNLVVIVGTATIIAGLVAFATWSALVIAAMRWRASSGK
jgi:hypothetical protein